jgi:hypothetical protein
LGGDPATCADEWLGLREGGGASEFSDVRAIITRRFRSDAQPDVLPAIENWPESCIN